MKNEEIPDFLEPYQVEKIAMEASTYIMPLYRELIGQGYDITVSYPLKTKFIACIAESRLKNDKVHIEALPYGGGRIAVCNFSHGEQERCKS